MSLFTIADLHLSVGADHPMDVFGARWENYTEKICKNWRAVVRDEDTVVIPGDISWGMTLAGAKADFALLDSLPGKKLLGKGNHDFWWETAAKLGRFFTENNFSTLSLLYNNAVAAEDFIVCGTRGWFYELEEPGGHTEKMRSREAGRLETSLKAAGEREKLCFLHYPPLYTGYRCEEMLRLLQQYGVKKCCYGHLHGGASHARAVQGEREGTDFSLVSADYLRFKPKKILE